MQVISTPTRTFKANAALVAYLRVKDNGSSKLIVAGALDRGLGTLHNRALAANDAAAVVLWSAPGTRKMVALGAIAQWAMVYGAAGGKINDVSNGNPIGMAMEAASGDNSVIEVLPIENLGLNATFVIGAEAADAINLGIQINDNLGNVVSHRVPLTLYLFNDANGDAFNSDNYTVAVGTDGAIAEAVADKVYECLTEADGDLDIDLTIVGAATTYAALKLPGRTDLIFSAVITHA